MIGDRLGPMLSVASNKLVLRPGSAHFLLFNLFGWSCKERCLRLACAPVNGVRLHTKHQTREAARRAAPPEYNPVAIKLPTNNAAIGLVKAAERNLSQSRSDREFRIRPPLFPFLSVGFLVPFSLLRPGRPRPTPSTFHPSTHASAALSITGLNKCN